MENFTTKCYYIPTLFLNASFLLSILKHYENTQIVAA